MPPRWAERLLGGLLPEDEREGVLGDLAEEFAARSAHGRPASGWYVREASRIGFGFLRERWIERRQGVAVDDVYGARGSARLGVGVVMEGFTKDLRTTVRSLVRRPAFLLAATLTLALGIGANTAIFSLLQRSLLQALPFPDPDGLVWLSDERIGEWTGNSSSILNLLDVAERSRTVENLAIYSSASFNLSDEEGAERVRGRYVSPEFFSVLGLPLQMGRDFTPEENLRGAEAVAILDHSIWSGRFGGDPDILGRTILVNSAPHTVIGVASEALEHAGLPKVFVPHRWELGDMNRGNRSVYALGRLAPGVELTAANTELAGIYEELTAEYPAANEGWSMSAVPYRETILGSGARRLLFILSGAAALVLLIACVNVANLLLARSQTRTREMAVRAALGAGRRRVIALFATEGLLLAGLGAVTGIALAAIGLPLLERYVLPGLPGESTPALNGPVLLFSIGAALLAGLLTGLAPAVTTRLVDLREGLREGGRGSTGRGTRLRQSLVVVQVALAVTLVAGAGLLLRSFWAVSSIDLGLEDPHEVLVFDIALPRAVYSDGGAIGDYYRTLTDRLGALPRVEAATVTNRLPLTGGTNVTQVSLLGAPDRTAGFMELRTVTPSYFEAAGIPILRGRGLREGDARGEIHDVVISERLATELVPDGDILGRQITLWGDFAPRVVGVAADTRDMGPLQDPPPTMFFDLGGAFQPSAESILLRVDGDPMELLADARAIVRDLDPAIAISGVQLLSDHAEGVVGRGRTDLLHMILIFGALALALGAIGIYGVMAFFVAQRRREMGVRIALGADRGLVTALVLRQGVRMTALGVVLGIVGAFGASRFLEAWLYEVEPLDPATHLSVAALLGMVSLLATWLPARRAARIDPMQAFRDE